MFDIGFLELMVVAILGLLVLGPERLPVAARSVGLLFGKVRRTVNNVQDELELILRAVREHRPPALVARRARAHLRRGPNLWPISKALSDAKASPMRAQSRSLGTCIGR